MADQKFKTLAQAAAAAEKQGLPFSRITDGAGCYWIRDKKPAASKAPAGTYRDPYTMKLGSQTLKVFRGVGGDWGSSWGMLPGQVLYDGADPKVAIGKAKAWWGMSTEQRAAALDRYYGPARTGLSATRKKTITKKKRATKKRATSKSPAHKKRTTKKAGSYGKKKTAAPKKTGTKAAFMAEQKRKGASPKQAAARWAFKTKHSKR